MWLYLSYAQIAQLVEQGTENPCVAGSIPALGTILIYENRFFSIKCQKVLKNPIKQYHLY